MARTEKFNVVKTGEDEYEITQIVTEKVNGIQLLGYYNGVVDGETNVDKALADIPVQVQKRTAEFNEQKNILGPRRLAFEKFAKEIQTKLEIEQKQKEEHDKALKEVETKGAMTLGPKLISADMPEMPEADR